MAATVFALNANGTSTDRHPSSKAYMNAPVQLPILSKSRSAKPNTSTKATATATQHAIHIVPSAYYAFKEGPNPRDGETGSSNNRRWNALDQITIHMAALTVQ